MKPESKPTAQGTPPKAPVLELGIPEEWVEPLQDLSYESLEKTKGKEKPVVKAPGFLSHGCP
jgi:hypothetical protein